MSPKVKAVLSNILAVFKSGSIPKGGRFFFVPCTRHALCQMVTAQQGRSVSPWDSRCPRLQTMATCGTSCNGGQKGDLHTGALY